MNQIAASSTGPYVKPLGVIAAEERERVLKGSLGRSKLTLESEGQPGKATECLVKI